MSADKFSKYWLEKKSFIQTMDDWTRARKPYVFVVPYSADGGYISQPNDIDENCWQYDFNGFSNEKKDGVFHEKWTFFPHFISFGKFKEGFDIVLKNLKFGNAYLVNYTCETPVESSLAPREIFHRANARYRLWMDGKCCVFSPEIFVRIDRDGNIHSFPMKGTADEKAQLLSDEKEAAEHATIVDLIRNDISQTSENVHVTRYRYAELLQTNSGKIWQTSSHITGKLLPEFRHAFGSALFSMLPAGSITGAPKRRVTEIVAEAENHERGLYSGVCGFFDGETLDSGVMIRFLEERDGKIFFKSGGGITAKSEIQKEYEEMKKKVYVPIY